MVLPMLLLIVHKMKFEIYKIFLLHHLTAINIGNNPNETMKTPVEIVDKWFLVMEQLLCGEEVNRKELPKTPVTPLLLETFDSLITLTKTIDSTCVVFNEIALLLRSQRVDKKTTTTFCNDEELFLGKFEK